MLYPRQNTIMQIKYQINNCKTMTNWQDNLKEIYDERLFLIEKSFNPELISEKEFKNFLSKGYEVVDENIIEKSIKDTSHLVKKEVWVVRKNGTSFKQTVWVKPIEGDSKKEKKVETPVGEEISPEVKGMQIEKYSDKSILIKGDTYANLETMRKIKSELNAGVFNRKLAGWIFPLNLVDKVLGFLWSDVEDEDKKLAIQNQKNASLSEGDTVTIEGQKGEIIENVSSNLGIRYNIRLEDGTLLEDVDEKVLSVGPELDDKKIQETINNAQPENRVKTEKKLYGIKPITDIHNYSLEEYMKMHGLSDEDVRSAMDMLKPKEKKEKRTTTPSSSPKKSTKGQTEGLTKRQLIFKLIYNHYQAVKSAVEAGNEVPEKALAVYGDLQEMYAKKRKELTEEHKRKIAEALKKNKAEEESEPREDKNRKGLNEKEKKNYKPKDGETFIIKSPANMVGRVPVEIKTKDYTDIPSFDISIPKAKNILERDKPYFIPNIDERRFLINGLTLPAQKVGEDKYLVALSGFTKGGYISQPSLDAINSDGDFAIMSLDLYAATQKYYQTKAKEQNKVNNIAKHQKRIDNLKIALEKLKSEGKTDKDLEYMRRSIADMEKQKPRQTRLSVYDKSNKMASDQMFMLMTMNRTEDGNFISRSKAWEIYRNELFKDREQKQIDLDLQQEHDESSFTKGRETSYGNTGLSDELFDDFGIKIKRQNGDKINKNETNQIKEAMTEISKVFGNNVNMNKEFGLKISHSGNVKQHASKATGIFFPFYRAIGVSNEYGGDMFNFVLAHEYAHFTDYWVGKKSGNHYASDKQGSTANNIARIFRNNLNKKSDSVYINRTCECFARAIELHTAVQTKGESAIVWDSQKYFEADNYVPKDVYEKELKPLIEQFFDENKDILKSFGNDLFGGYL